MSLVPYLQDPDVTLYCGDALEVLRQLPDASVDCCVTDPPYGETSITWDVQVRDWLPLVARVLKPEGSVWIFGSFRFFVGSRDEFGNGWKLAQEIVWEKHNGSSFHADRFKRVHELAAQFYRGRWDRVWKQPVTTNDATARAVRRKQRPPHTGHIEASAYTSHDGGPRLQRSVIHVRSCHGEAVHPTQKPLGILRPLIEYSCPPGGVVLDPFAGACSTGVAAREVGRGALLIEIDAAYCESGGRRLAQAPLLSEVS